ncbi:MFS transporter [Streptomyces sp. NPDC019937]|uniref:MFS transporter n=1 Tax=Streptomyces sp. NPDC019937 TaxID=3154787 RepID=UPI0033D0C723
MDRLSLTAALRHRPFRLLYGGQAISSVGDWLDYLALVVLLTYTWGHGAGALAALSVAVAVPMVALAPVAGALADRMSDRIRVLVGCDVIRAGLALGYLAAPDLPVLLVLVVCKVSFGALFNPVHQSTLRSVVPEADLLSAMSLTVFTNQAAKVAGPALSGLLIAAFGVRAAFIVDAATFLVSAALLSAVRLPPRPDPKAAAPDGAEEPTARTGLRADIAEGMRFIARTPALIALIGSVAATLFLVLTFDTLSPLAMRELGVGESSLGYVVAAVGLGAALGTLAISGRVMRAGPFVVLGVAQIVVGAAVSGIGTGLGLDAHGMVWLWMPIAGVLGFAAAGIMVVFPYVLHRETPPELTGRVTAIANAFPVLLQLAAPPLGAALADWAGVGFVFLTAGPALAALGAVVWLYGTRVRRRGEHPNEHPNPHRDDEQPPPPTGRADTMPDTQRLDALRAAGFPVDALTPGQRDALHGLSDEEADLLISVQLRLHATADEVEAHSGEPIIGGVLF